MAYVRIDMDDIDTEDLVDELEARGYKVIDSDENDFEQVLDDINNLYRDFIYWKDYAMKDSNFESALKRFFEKHTDKIVV